MSFQINNVTVSGNLTRDPENRATPGGVSIVSFGLAWNERRKDKATGEYGDVAHFFDVTAFGGQGEWLARSLKKGDPITVSGTLEQQRWQDKTSGEARSKVGIVCRDFTVGQRADARSDQSSAPAGQQSTGYGDSAPYATSGYGGSDF